jgi:hypothetical protein
LRNCFRSRKINWYVEKNCWVVGQRPLTTRDARWLCSKVPCQPNLPRYTPSPCTSGHHALVRASPTPGRLTCSCCWSGGGQLTSF